MIEILGILMFTWWSCASIERERGGGGLVYKGSFGIMGGTSKVKKVKLEVKYEGIWERCVANKRTLSTHKVRAPHVLYLPS